MRQACCLNIQSTRVISMEYGSNSSRETKPRRSPPPLVSVHDTSRRTSLVGLQRLVYNSQIFSVPGGGGAAQNGHSDTEVDSDTMVDSEKVSSPRSHSQHSVGPRPKRSRTSFTPAQLERLEEDFCVDMYVVGLKRMKLANELDLSERQVKVWFQNRRMKYKRDRSKMCIGMNK